MSTPKKKTRRNDGVLSPEELAKAIEEYKARRAKETAPAADGDAPTTDPVVSAEPETAPTEPTKDGEGDTTAEGVEAQVAEIKDRNADADGDMKLLFDIIDTLLAEKAFDEACKDGDEPAATDPDAAAPTDKKPADGVAVADGEGECADKNCDDDDDPVPTTDPSDVKPGEVMNADSIDAIVRERVSIARMAEKLNLDGLDGMPIKAAKKVVIKAVTPSLRLDGKSDAYVNALYDRAVADVEARSKKDVGYQLKQMFNKDARTVVADEDSAESRRRAMIERRQNRSKKEDK